MIAAADLAFGRTVRYQGHAAESIDVSLRANRLPRVQIRVKGAITRRIRWVRAAELEATDAA